MVYLFDIDKLIKENYFKFLIGYSGGLDSSVLLYNIVLLKNKYKQMSLRVIHINHNINPLSKIWSTHCYKQCKKLQLNLIIVNVKHNIIDILKKQYGGIESSARYIRYKIYHKHILKDEILLLGHHLQDQTENFILSLKRSSGPRGLSGIKIKTFIGRLCIYRPMLHISKDKIYSYAVSNKLSWVEDPSNKDCYYDRNYIRWNLLPILRNKWPFIERSISKSSFLCSLQEELLSEYIVKELNNLMNFKNDSLNFVPLLPMSPAKQYYILRLWINKIKPNLIPSYTFILHILKNVIYTKIDSNPKLKFNNFEIRKYKDYIYLVDYISEKDLKQIIIQCFYPWKKLQLPYNLGYIIQVNQNSLLGTKIIKPKNNENIYIKFGINEKILLSNLDKSWHLNKYLKAKSVPHWGRCRIPLLFYNNTLIASPNLFVCKKANPYYIGNKLKTTNYFSLQWIPPKYLLFKQ